MFEIVQWAPVGGGVLALSPLPSGQAAQAMSLEWRPQMVISLTEAQEMVDCHLEQALAKAGVLWRHAPIRDFGVPEAGFEAAWPTLSQEALSLLSKGGRVLVHCKGGCGRSGMVVLRLMIESGETPAVALDWLRGRRPCAVETQDQLVWAQKTD